MTCTFTAATSRGSRRKNQDNMRVDSVLAYLPRIRRPSYRGAFSDEAAHFFCVCDGIGGERDGAEASKIALVAVDDFLRRTNPAAPLGELSLGAASAAQDAVSEYYRALRHAGGTTLTLLATRDEEFFFLNIGDSPAFHYRAAENSYLELSFRHNLETQKRAENIPVLPGDERYLTAYLGDFRRRASDMAHTCAGAARPGDSVLLCSDGVSNAFDAAALEQALRSKTPAKLMVARAAAMRGADNCTAIHLLF